MQGNFINSSYTRYALLLPAELHVLFLKIVLFTTTADEFHSAMAPAERPKLLVKLLSRSANEVLSLV